MLRVRNLGGERVEALEAAPASEPDTGFSPLGRNHTFQSQLHQTSDAALIFYGASMLLPLPAATPGVRCWPS